MPSLRLWLLSHTSLLTSGFNLDEPTQLAGRIHRMIKPGLGSDDDYPNVKDLAKRCSPSSPLRVAWVIQHFP